MLSASVQCPSSFCRVERVREAMMTKLMFPLFFCFPFPAFLRPLLRSIPPPGQSASVFAHSPQHPIPDGKRSLVRSLADTDGEQGQGARPNR